MGKQLHKRFVEDQVKDIVTKYIEKKLRAKEACRYLGIGRTRLHQLVKDYLSDPQKPVAGYKRSVPTRKIKQSIKEHILAELSFEKEKIIDNPNVPTNRYNYSYIRNLLIEKYDEQVSLPTIITLAKTNDFWKSKRKREQIHTRQLKMSVYGLVFRFPTTAINIVFFATLKIGISFRSIQPTPNLQEMWTPNGIRF